MPGVYPPRLGVDVIPSVSPLNVVCHGNSLTFGTGQTAGTDYPTQLAALLRSGDTVSNQGFASYTTADLSAGSGLAGAFETVVTPNRSTRKTNVLIFWEIRNHLRSFVLASNSNPPQAAHDAAVTYIAAARALGWYVINATIIATLTTSVSVANINACNALVRADLCGAHALLDLEVNAAFNANGGAQTNTTYFQGDQIHITTAGAALVAALAKTALQNLLGGF